MNTYTSINPDLSFTVKGINHVFLLSSFVWKSQKNPKKTQNNTTTLQALYTKETIPSLGLILWIFSFCMGKRQSQDAHTGRQ